MSRRGTSSKNIAGNSYDRRRRREYLIATFGIPRRKDGRKTRVRCAHCGKAMRAWGKSWEVDRFPVCGHDGGRYVRGNIVISCRPCNQSRCMKGCRRGAPAIVASYAAGAA